MAERNEGIYINQGNCRVKRVGIGAPLPSGSERVRLSEYLNITLTAIRELALSKKLATRPEGVVWE